MIMLHKVSLYTIPASPFSDTVDSDTTADVWMRGKQDSLDRHMTHTVMDTHSHTHRV